MTNDLAQFIPEAEAFYKSVVEILQSNKIPFMVGGTHAVNEYTGLKRLAKDLDLYCKAGDYTYILKLLQESKFKTEITDVRWLAKVKKGPYQIDFIFSTANDVCRVDDSWFASAPWRNFLGYKAQVVSPEELIWIKSYMQDRRRSEGPDVNHLFLKTGKHLNWKRLLSHMDSHWEILLSNIIIFRFVYPSEREIIPKWLIEELINRVIHEFTLPTPKEKVCRGLLLSRVDYAIDVTEWSFKTALEV